MASASSGTHRAGPSWTNPFRSLGPTWPPKQADNVHIPRPESLQAHKSNGRRQSFCGPVNGISSWPNFKLPSTRDTVVEDDEAISALANSLRRNMPNRLVQQPRKDGTVIIDYTHSDVGYNFTKTHKMFGNDALFHGEHTIAVGMKVSSIRKGAIFLTDFDVKSQSYAYISANEHVDQERHHERVMLLEIVGAIDMFVQSEQVLDKGLHFIRPGDYLSKEREKGQASAQAVEIYQDKVFARLFKTSGIKLYTRYDMEEVYRTMSGQAPVNYRTVMVPPDRVKAKTRAVVMVDEMINLYGLDVVRPVQCPFLRTGDFVNRSGRVAVIVGDGPDTVEFINVGHMQSCALEKRWLGLPLKLLLKEECLFANDDRGNVLAVGHHVVISESLTACPLIASIFACFHDFVVLQMKNSENGYHWLSLPGSKTRLVADFVDGFDINKRASVEQRLRRDALDNRLLASNNSALWEPKTMPVAEERVIDFYSSSNGSPTSFARQFCRAMDHPQPVSALSDVTYEVGCRPLDLDSLAEPFATALIIPVRGVGFEKKIKPVRDDFQFLSAFPPSILLKDNIYKRETKAMVPFWVRDHIRVSFPNTFRPLSIPVARLHVPAKKKHRAGRKHKKKQSVRSGQSASGQSTAARNNDGLGPSAAQATKGFTVKKSRKWLQTPSFKQREDANA